MAGDARLRARPPVQNPLFPFRLASRSLLDHPSAKPQKLFFALSSPIHTRWTSPRDEDLDEFESKNAEVDAWFRDRTWFNTTKGKASPPTITFFLGDESPIVIGYASFVTKQAKDLTVYVMGINANFAGKKNPASPEETYAQSIFRLIEGIARDKNCKGLSLWVRNNNDRAICFYEKCGFVRIETVSRDKRAPHLTMRKPLEYDA